MQERSETETKALFLFSFKEFLQSDTIGKNNLTFYVIEPVRIREPSVFIESRTSKTYIQQYL